MSLIFWAQRAPLHTSFCRHGLRICTLLALAALWPGCGSSEDDLDDEAVAAEPRSRDGGVSDAGAKPAKGKDAGTTKPVVNKPTTMTPSEDPGDMMCAGIEQSTPAARTAVDIIFVIDTSGSMIDERDKVTANMANFMRDFESTPADTHVVVVTDVDPAQGNADPKSYRFVPSSVDSKLLYTTAGITLPLYSDFLRPNAVTHMVFISDDNDIFPGDAFKATMEQTLGHGFTFHAIVATQGGPSCGGFSLPGAVGENYLSLARSTGGKELPICTADWSEVFGELKKGIVEAVPLPCDYPLADAMGDAFDASKLQMVHTPEGGQPTQFPKASERSACGDQPGWHYDSEASPTTISLCPAACELVRAGGTIRIVLGCPPVPIVI